ncbi:MAG: NfeD family protein, partial [Pirellulaceae bacterium]
GVTSLAIPLVLALAIHWWPHTPLGRRILNPPPENPDDVLPDTSEYRRLKSMIGQRGKATCDMLPSGTVRIDHRLYEAVSLGMPIDAGDRVEVVEVRMNRLVVRPCTEAEPAQHAEVRADEDLLSRPFDSLGLEDPLAE